MATKVERGTCDVCHRLLLRTADDCWHPWSVVIGDPCPPEPLVNGVHTIPWGESFGRPGREHFVSAASPST